MKIIKPFLSVYVQYNVLYIVQAMSVLVLSFLKEIGQLGFKKQKKLNFYLGYTGQESNFNCGCQKMATKKNLKNK